MCSSSDKLLSQRLPPHFKSKQQPSQDNMKHQTREERGKYAVWLKSLSVRCGSALFAVPVVHSKGKIDIGWFDMIKAQSLVMESRCIVGSTWLGARLVNNVIRLQGNICGGLCKWRCPHAEFF